ncbi:hypothetical protein NCWK1_4131 [Nostoc cycadae WK-1]|uniref:Uncharacterized protein n=1 Tax=Nostoc cycadae WK-1 TaxID=1861711 RepID=A0A2H6LMC3_9NOSO|nr:hypothetical protein NCWK1_4131 [Nostoc cycadae WK-1]
MILKLFWFSRYKLGKFTSNKISTKYDNCQNSLAISTVFFENYIKTQNKNIIFQPNNQEQNTLAILKD